MIIGKYPSPEASLASAALYCAGARIVSTSADLVLLVQVKAASRPMRLGVPLIAIVPRAEQKKALAAGADAAYAQPAGWKAYSRLVEQVLSEWTPTRRGSARRRGRPR
jgi:hypothetical protein